MRWIQTIITRLRPPERPVPIPGHIGVVPPTIYCGNCVGVEDETEPRKTFLDSRNLCATCGGNSYVLASAWSKRPHPRALAKVAVVQHELRRTRFKVVEKKESA
jgi:hypothetical protein